SLPSLPAISSMDQGLAPDLRSLSPWVLLGAIVLGIYNLIKRCCSKNTTASGDVLLRAVPPRDPTDPTDPTDPIDGSSNSGPDSEPVPEPDSEPVPEPDSEPVPEPDSEPDPE
ncbi:hypothetical protein PFISCL1PPCAC_9193, partial [Pristionchus fissidentatus]